MTETFSGQQFGGYSNNLRIIQGETQAQCESSCLANATCVEASYVVTIATCILYSDVPTLESTGEDEAVHLRKDCTPGNDIALLK